MCIRDREEELVEPTDNVYDNAVAEAVKEPKVIDAAFEEVTPAAEVAAPEPEIAPEKTVSETTPAEKSKPEDPIDVSAGIISNFAKMFSHEEPAAAIVETPVPVISAPGNTDKTLEEFVLEAITKVIGKEISSQWNNGAEFKAFAEAEIIRQTKEWLNDNLPLLVEKVVKQEIERVIAKVGS